MKCNTRYLPCLATAIHGGLFAVSLVSSEHVFYRNNRPIRNGSLSGKFFVISRNFYTSIFLQ